MMKSEELQFPVVSGYFWIGGEDDLPSVTSGKEQAESKVIGRNSLPHELPEILRDGKAIEIRPSVGL
jgi:hypothetical protein